MQRANVRFAHRLSGVFIALGLAAGIAACGEDESQLPEPDVLIEVTESNFKFIGSPETHVGDRIEWRNVYSRSRTVISGTGPNDPHRGELFDEVLSGYKSGKAYGGQFQFVATEPDTIHFFNTLLPPNFPSTSHFDGTIIVSP